MNLYHAHLITLKDIESGQKLYSFLFDYSIHNSVCIWSCLVSSICVRLFFLVQLKGNILKWVKSEHLTPTVDVSEALKTSNFQAAWWEKNVYGKYRCYFTSSWWKELVRLIIDTLSNAMLLRFVIIFIGNFIFFSYKHVQSYT